MKFDSRLVAEIVKEVREEQFIAPTITDNNFVKYVQEGMFNINSLVGSMVDYNEDLDARSLLKNYVLYANYKRLAEFKELYMSDYVALQIKYNNDTELQ